MGYVTLAAVICTALTGLVILGAWLTRGEVRRSRSAHGRHRRLPPQLVFGHMTFAVAGATAWVVYLIIGRPYAGWVTLALLVLAALLGITMFVRWIPTYRRSPGPLLRAAPGAAHRAPASSSNLPIAAVLAHGAFAVTTLALVVISVLLW